MTILYHASTSNHAEWGGPRQWVRVVLHETNEELEKAAAKMEPHGNWAGVGGSFHRAGPDRANPSYVGLIRLSKENYTNEVVVHECVHAGIAIYRDCIKEKVNLGSEVGPKEEALCYIIGDITEAVILVLPTT